MWKVIFSILVLLSAAIVASEGLPLWAASAGTRNGEWLGGSARLENLYKIQVLSKSKIYRKYFGLPPVDSMTEDDRPSEENVEATQESPVEQGRVVGTSGLEAQAGGLEVEVAGEGRRLPRPGLSPFEFLQLIERSNAILKLRNPNVVCLPVDSCAVVYGSYPEHFSQFGFISPAEANCLSGDGLALCVANTVTTTTTTVTTTTMESTTTVWEVSTVPPSLPTYISATPTVVQLPCVPASQCRESFQNTVDHLFFFGSQGQCANQGSVVCINPGYIQPSHPDHDHGTAGVHPEVTDPVVAGVNLPCVPLHQCSILFDQSSKFSEWFGRQSRCYRDGDVVCLVQVTPPKPDQPTQVQWTQVGTQAAGPPLTSTVVQQAVSGVPVGGYQIQGPPGPIYISLSSIVGRGLGANFTQALQGSEHKNPKVTFTP